MTTPDPTPMDADYYPRIKFNRRWYLIVPELNGENPHEGCAFYCPVSKNGACSLITEAGGDSGKVTLFNRVDCGKEGVIFVAPSKFPEYRAHLVVEKLEGKDT